MIIFPPADAANAIGQQKEDEALKHTEEEKGERDEGGKTGEEEE